MSRASRPWHGSERCNGHGHGMEIGAALEAASRVGWEGAMLMTEPAASASCPSVPVAQSVLVAVARPGGGDVHRSAANPPHPDACSSRSGNAIPIRALASLGVSRLCRRRRLGRGQSHLHASTQQQLCCKALPDRLSLAANR